MRARADARRRGWQVLSPTLQVGFYHAMPHEKCAALLFLLRHAGAPGTEAGPSAEPGGAVGRGLLGAIPLSGSVFERITPRGLEFGHSGLRSDASAPDAGEAPRRRTMVFCATRHSVELLRAVLEHAGVRVAAVHGAMDQGQRNGALEAFKVASPVPPWNRAVPRPCLPEPRAPRLCRRRLVSSAVTPDNNGARPAQAREVEVLLATDVAARGLDVPLLDAVGLPRPSAALSAQRAPPAARCAASGSGPPRDDGRVCPTHSTSVSNTLNSRTVAFLGNRVAGPAPCCPAGPCPRRAQSARGPPRAIPGREGRGAAAR